MLYNIYRPSSLPVGLYSLPAGGDRILSPGAAISILSSPGFDSRDLPPLESWSLLGHTPLTVSGCRLNDEIKADWEGREIFFPEYHGSGRILFNFEEEKVKEE